MHSGNSTSYYDDETLSVQSLNVQSSLQVYEQVKGVTGSTRPGRPTIRTVHTQHADKNVNRWRFAFFISGDQQGAFYRR